MLAQQIVSNELSLIQIPFDLFLLSANLRSFLSRMHFISIRLIFLKKTMSHSDILTQKEFSHAQNICPFILN